MRIGVVGPDQEDDFAANVADGLRDLGHEAVMTGPTLRVRHGQFASRIRRVVRDGIARHPRFGAHLANGLLETLRRNDVDLVITVESLRPDVVETLSRRGIPVALWFPDAVSNLGPMWMFSAPYRALFFKEPVLVDRVRRMVELPVHYLPEACNPRIHRVPLEAERLDSVAVVGNIHPLRARLLEQLVHDNVPLALYGPELGGFMRSHPLRRLHTGRYVRGAEKALVFRGSAAVLNNLHPAEMEGVNCRLFEATACGAATVTEHRLAVDDLFTSDEVFAFTNYDELRTTLLRLVGNPLLGREAGDRAAARAAADHTYAIRLERLLEVTS
jgi:spore maturation protein CgeB